MNPETHDAAKENGMKKGPSVHYNGKQLFAPSDSMKGVELYDLFGVPQNHRLYLEAPGSHPDTPIKRDETKYDLKPGSHYYDLPEGQFGALLPRVEAELQALRDAYPGEGRVTTDLQPDGNLLVTIRDVPVPSGWNRQTTRLRFVVPPGYPQARPSGFSVDDGFALATGAPGSGGGEANFADGKWRSYCWQPKAWEMSRETLLRYAKFAEARFHEVQ